MTWSANSEKDNGWGGFFSLMIFISNRILTWQVNFAATKEALSLYFTECGVVENIVVLTDKTTGQPKGYTFFIQLTDFGTKRKILFIPGQQFARLC